MHAPNFKNPEIEQFKIRHLLKVNPNFTELKPQRIFLNRTSAILRVDMIHYFEWNIWIQKKKNLGKPHIPILSKKRKQKKTMKAMHLYNYDLVNTTSILTWITVPIEENKEKQK